MGLFYSLLNTVFVFTFILITKKKGYHLDLKERFVIHGKRKKKGYLWFHCASVGELNLAKPLIEYFSKNNSILITVFSPRGKEYAEKLYPYATVVALPFDFSFTVKRFLNIYNPKALVIVEGELWYNLITKSSKKIPVISANTRISPKSFKFYKAFSFFFKRILDSFSLLTVRSKKDFEFLNKFLSCNKKAVLCGDLKIVSSGKTKNVYLDKKGKKVIVAGSTHHPEEKLILDIYKNIKKDFPETSLIIAPRHLERVKEIKELIKKYNFSYSLRTQIDKLSSDIYILNTVGELSGIYRYADVVFVGGTFAPIGGHNILEPVYFKKPVVIGKHYEKILDIYKYLKEKNAVFCAKNEKQLEDFIRKALSGKITLEINLEEEGNKIFNCYVKHIQKELEKRWS